MVRLLVLVVSIGLADSLNPSTIAPALYLAGGEHATTKVAEFAIGVFFVYLIGGALIALGIGQLVLSVVPHPDHEDRYVIETIAGVAVIAVSAFVWIYRRQLAKRALPIPNRESRSGAVLGATITVVELPTAFPYFAVIAAIIGSGLGVASQALLLLLFNVCFVVPLLGILIVLRLPGDRPQRLLAAGRRRLERNWPVALSILFLIVGLFVTVIGASGLAGLSHSHAGRFFRKVHKFLHP